MGSVAWTKSRDQERLHFNVYTCGTWLAQVADNGRDWELFCGGLSLGEWKTLRAIKLQVEKWETARL